MIDGEILGTWSRTFGKEEVAITVVPFARLTRAQQALVHDAAGPFGAFHGLKANVEFS